MPSPKPGSRAWPTRCARRSTAPARTTRRGSAVATAYVHFATRDAALLELMFAAKNTRPPDAVRDASERLFTAFGELIVQGQKAGTLPPGDPGRLACSSSPPCRASPRSSPRAEPRPGRSTRSSPTRSRSSLATGANRLRASGRGTVDPGAGVLVDAYATASTHGPHGGPIPPRAHGGCSAGHQEHRSGRSATCRSGP